jgi:hypothetical protein
MNKLLIIFLLLTYYISTILSSSRPVYRSYCKSDQCVCVRNLDTIRYMRNCPNTAANKCLASGYCGMKPDKSCGWSLSSRIIECLNKANHCRKVGCHGQVCELNIGPVTINTCSNEPWVKCLLLGGVCGARNDASCGWSGNKKFVACMRRNGYPGHF